MAFASWASLAFYGPGAGAMVVSGVGATDAAIKARGRLGGSSAGVGAVPLARGTRLVSRPATLQGAGAVSGALPKARARIAAAVRVNTLSQDDVTGAVLEGEIEPGVTVKEALRIALAVLAGKSGVSGGTVTFRDVNDGITRVSATVNAGGERTAVTLNAANA